MLLPPPSSTLFPYTTLFRSAALSGVDQVWGIGGAQAIGALAYGTESIAPVDKIVGPGNAYVAAAKRRVFGTVRSEEHTSELQSRGHLVCRLLLEKKKYRSYR